MKSRIMSFPRMIWWWYILALFLYHIRGHLLRPPHLSRFRFKNLMKIKIAAIELDCDLVIKMFSNLYFMLPGNKMRAGLGFHYYFMELGIEGYASEYLIIRKSFDGKELGKFGIIYGEKHHH